jgi:hypothetical protein
LFAILDLPVSSNKSIYFGRVLEALVQHFHGNITSSLEVHQRVSFVAQQLFYENNERKQNDEKNLLDSLLKLSWIKKEFFPYSKKELFTKSDIDLEL